MGVKNVGKLSTRSQPCGPQNKLVCNLCSGAQGMKKSANASKFFWWQVIDVMFVIYIHILLARNQLHGSIHS